MSNRTDTILRETFEGMAASAPLPDGLARAALGRARRQRHTQAGLIAGAGVACAAAIAAGVLLAPDGPSTVEPAIPAGTRTIVAFTNIHVYPATLPTTTPKRGEGPQSLDPFLPLDVHSLLLDPVTGRYEKMPYEKILPSPDGTRALVWERPPLEPGQRAVPFTGKIGVWERRSGAVRWFAETGDLSGVAQWSADSKRILFMRPPGRLDETPREQVMVLANPDTMAVDTVRLATPERGAGCGPVSLVWLPGDTGVAESTYCAHGNAFLADGVRTYDLTGRRTGSLQVDGAVVPGLGYSPDGALLLLEQSNDGLLVVVDARTGAERGRIPLRNGATLPTGAGVLGWYDATHLAVYAVTGDSDNHRATLQVIDLSGRVTSTVDVPYHSQGQKILGTVGR